MAHIHGKVEAVGKANNGGYTPFKIDDVWYSVKGNAPPRGATVLFEAEQNDGGYWNVKGKVEEKSGPPANTAQNEAQGSKKGASKSPEEQLSIQYQTALKASAEVTAALANAGRYKSLTDQELDQEVIERTKRYFDSVKNLGGSAAPIAKPKPASNNNDPDDDIPF